MEVKGVAGGKPSTLLTWNELRSAREDSNWELAVVTKALSSPTLSIYYPEDVVDIAESMLYRVDLPPVSRPTRGRYARSWGKTLEQ